MNYLEQILKPRCFKSTCIKLRIQNITQTVSWKTNQLSLSKYYKLPRKATQQTQTK